MKILRYMAGAFASYLLLVGWAAWKYAYPLPIPNISIKYYILSGIGVFIILLVGKVVGIWVGRLSFIPTAYLILMMIFSKTATWESLDGYRLLSYTGIGLLIALIMYVLGDEGFGEGWNSGGSSGGSSSGGGGGSISSGSNYSNDTTETTVAESPVKNTYVEPPKPTQTHCLFCNSTSYGSGCSWSSVKRRNSSSKIHVHNPADGKCVYCGMKNVVGMGCPHSPSGLHMKLPA